MLFYDKLKKNRQDLKDEGPQRNSAKNTPQRHGNNTNIQRCIEAEMIRYFELLDGQAPHDLYRMVMTQVETSLIRFVLEECGNNQSRTAEYLGISRGTLRNKLTEQGLI